ncbi:MAG: UvrB/UvrC motif-containing protein [Clostridia bacterium]|nr:UvrB/UvrC motif-containing protein [Clostridia bacterium]
MLCSHCNKREANFHYKQVNNGSYTELHLCSDCARELGYLGAGEQSFSPGLEDMLNEFLGLTKQSQTAGKGISCSCCGTTFAEFKKTGLAGCDKCYDVFARDVESVLSRIQPSTTHKGKIAGPKGEQIQRQNEIKELKDKLRMAVMEERYEDAAKLRDSIKKLEENNGGETNV